MCSNTSLFYDFVFKNCFRKEKDEVLKQGPKGIKEVRKAGQNIEH